MVGGGWWVVMGGWRWLDKTHTTHTHPHLSTHSPTHPHPHPHTHCHTHTPTPTHPHPPTPTNNHTHPPTHTHTHTHTPAPTPHPHPPPHSLPHPHPRPHPPTLTPAPTHHPPGCTSQVWLHLAMGLEIVCSMQVAGCRVQVVGSHLASFKPPTSSFPQARNHTHKCPSGCPHVPMHLLCVFLWPPNGLLPTPSPNCSSRMVVANWVLGPFSVQLWQHVSQSQDLDFSQVWRFLEVFRRQQGPESGELAPDLRVPFNDPLNLRANNLLLGAARSNAVSSVRISVRPHLGGSSGGQSNLPNAARPGLVYPGNGSGKFPRNGARFP